MSKEQEFTLGGVKLIQDEDGYGIAHLREDGNWEVVANFKYVGNFISFITAHLRELQDREKAIQSIHEQIGVVMPNESEEEEKNND